MRGARIKGGENSYYHCISRVIDRKFVLKRQEKDRLVELLVQASTFSGVEVVTYVMMGNHFHLLIKANPDVVVTDPMLADRLKCLYGQSRTADIMTLLGDLKSRGDFASAEEYKRRFTCRMQDVSQFMKLFKQLYTRWHNSKYKRKGTLWEDRFKSVLVESGQALKMMAAYLDLNPVRAGIVTDPRDYRWSGYGAACAGGEWAKQGIERVFEEDVTDDQRMTEDKIARYRVHMYLVAESTETKDAPRVAKDGQPRMRCGIDREEVRKVVEAEGKLSLGQLLMCRVRYFSDGVAIGTEAFVEKIFEKNRKWFSKNRESGARRIRHAADDVDIMTLRDLRMSPIGFPGQV